MAEPSYLALLNTIAVNEKKGELFLTAWADKTPDQDLAADLRFVAIREGEHAWAFTKRLCELGCAVCEDDAFQVFADFDGLMDCVSSDTADADKVAYVSSLFTGGDGSDPFATMFQDTSIDPTTGALLGRYIAEERDSGRRLQAAYARISSANGGLAARASEAELDELKASIKALRKEVKALRKLQAA